jgi:diguanylate cyclase (GGDEF)-like protein/PAS domain S-box-containing protein
MTENRKRTKKPTPSALTARALRRKAEELVREQSAQDSAELEAFSAEESRKLLHELRVQQVQLEMQNEELRRTQAELEAARSRYYDLYDLAPVGYVTIDDTGLIIEANLAAAWLLGVARTTLVKQPLTRFVQRNDHGSFHLRRKQLFESGDPQTCELRMLKSDGTEFSAHLTATTAHGASGSPVGRVVLTDITERKQAVVQLQYLSLHDALTGLYNHGFFEASMERLQRGRHFPVSVLMADVDNLKAVNDRYGHAAGDSLLKEVAHLLTASFRADDVVARLGGDEFVVLMPETNASAAEGALRRFRQALEDHNSPAAETPLRVSCGVGTCEKGDPVAEALKKADANMYLEKQANGGAARQSHLPEGSFVKPNTEQALRRKAEEIVLEARGQPPQNFELLSMEQMRQALHELQVHQIELSMQNEELSRVQAEVDAARARYFDLYELAPLGYVTLGSGGRILEANLRAAALLGVARSSLTGQPFTRHIVRTDQDHYYRFRKRLAETGAPQACELQMSRKEGPAFWARLEAAIAQDDDGSSVYRIVVSDISERKQSEAHILKLNALLEQRVEERTSQLSAALSELGSFSYSVSHDLRSPLRAVDGFSQMLSESYGDKLDDEGKELIDRLRKAAQRMGELIDGLLALSRLSRSELNRAPLDLSDMAAKIVARLKEAHPEHPVDFAIAAGLTTNADPVLVQAVLENLIGNAWKYTGKREGAEAEFSAFDQDGQRVFFIRDNGVGFDPAYADRLFQAFQRLHAAEEFAGTGIGLATVRRIVSRHGGKVWADGEVGNGATFYFTLSE